MPPKTSYVTVDLVVKGDHGTENLTACLEANDYFVQKHDWNDGNRWYLNVSCPRDFGEAEACIDQYCEDLSRLPAEARSEWELARYREFFIGYHVGLAPPCYDNHPSAGTIAKVAGLGAGIGIALYPDPDEDG